MTPEPQNTAPVVVGVDGSPGAAIALRWALNEAAVRGTAVRAVYAWGFIDRYHTGGDRTFDAAYGQQEAEASLAEAVTAVVGPDGGSVPVEQKAVKGDPVPTLLHEADDAGLLVVGARGLGGFRRLVLGSVSEQCLTHATCPVAIVKQSDEPVRHGAIGRILVGVDGSEQSKKALLWAFDEARRRDAAVDVVHAWDLPAVAHMGALTLDPSIFEETAREVLDETMREVAPQAEGLDVRPMIARGHAARVVIERSPDVDLVVVGARGLGGFAGMLLGSTSRSVAYHATCAVVAHRSPED